MRPRYVAEVVRGDVRLDLALVRIVALDGTPLPEGTTFPTVEIADTTDLELGAAVWALGFPMATRAIHVTGGSVSGFEMSTEGQVAWLRTDVEANPGSSGGMLVDARGRLVAVPTTAVSFDMVDAITLARPVDRIPEEWRIALASGAPIERADVTGIYALHLPEEITDHATGDAAHMRLDEDHYFALPTSAATQWVEVTTTPAVHLFLRDAQADAGIFGDGTLRIGPGRGPVFGMRLSRAEDGTAPEVRLRARIVTGEELPDGSTTP